MVIPKTLLLTLTGLLFFHSSEPSEHDRMLFCLWQTVFAEEMPPVDEWAGMERRKGVVWKIWWNHRSGPEVKSLDWFPPTLRKLRLYKRERVAKRLDTRRLPRMLTFCLIVSCDLIGQVEMRTLPVKLEILNLQCNNLTGAIYITHLPNPIGALLLKNNPLHRVFVDNTKLPESLEKVQVYNGEHEVKIRSIDELPVDRRVVCNNRMESNRFNDFYYGR